MSGRYQSLQVHGHPWVLLGTADALLAHNFSQYPPSVFNKWCFARRQCMTKTRYRFNNQFSTRSLALVYGSQHIVLIDNKSFTRSLMLFRRCTSVFSVADALLLGRLLTNDQAYIPPGPPQYAPRHTASPFHSHPRSKLRCTTPLPSVPAQYPT